MRDYDTFPVAASQDPNEAAVGHVPILSMVLVRTGAGEQIEIVLMLLAVTADAARCSTRLGRPPKMLGACPAHELLPIEATALGHTDACAATSTPSHSTRKHDQREAISAELRSSLRTGSETRRGDHAAGGRAGRQRGSDDNRSSMGARTI
jgi:hypothetical protein